MDGYITDIQEIYITAKCNSQSVLLETRMIYLISNIPMKRERTMITIGNSFFLSRVVALANVFHFYVVYSL